MNREMYKKDRQLPDTEARELFAKGHHGVLSLNGDDGYPYGVPVNYVFIDGIIYMHSAKYGYKMDLIKENSKACFSSILRSEIIQTQVTAKFESIIATGDVRVVDDVDERKQVLDAFVTNFTPDFLEGGRKFAKAVFDKTAILRFDIKELKGKAYRGNGWK